MLSLRAITDLYNETTKSNTRLSRRGAGDLTQLKPQSTWRCRTPYKRPSTKNGPSYSRRGFVRREHRHRLVVPDGASPAARRCKSSISLPSGSSMCRRVVTVWSLAPTIVHVVAPARAGMASMSSSSALAHLEAEVVQPGAVAVPHRRRVLADLEQQQLVVGTAVGAGESAGAPRVALRRNRMPSPARSRRRTRDHSRFARKGRCVRAL